jgi:hypothetical protein
MAGESPTDSETLARLARLLDRLEPLLPKLEQAAKLVDRDGRLSLMSMLGSRKQ